MSQHQQVLSSNFRPVVQPRVLYSVSSTLLVCTLIQLLFAAPFAANERRTAGASTALRGLLLGILASFINGPVFLVNSPILTRGGFHRRFLLSLPITLGAATGAAFIPSSTEGGSTIGLLSITQLTVLLTYAVATRLLISPFYATDEHKALQRSFGPPNFALLSCFFGAIVLYVFLAQNTSSPLVGLLLPLCSLVTRALAMHALVHSYHTFYYSPKQEFLTQQRTLVASSLEPSCKSTVVVVPPILGDVEIVYANMVATFALNIGNVASAATLMQAMLSPASSAWVIGLTASSLLELLTRIGTMQRIELWVATRLSAKFGMDWLLRFSRTNSLKVLYLRSLKCTRYMAATIAICIGCLRALTFGDPAAIVWLDASPTVWRVLVTQLALALIVESIVWVVERNGEHHFELSERFVADHPLRNTAFRDFGLVSYFYTFSNGGVSVYIVFLAFLGPAFVTGVCRDFDPDDDQIWVWNAIKCGNAAAATAH